MASNALKFLVGSIAVYLAVAACNVVVPVINGLDGGDENSDGAGISSDAIGMPDARADESGSRIKARYYAGEDGSRAAAGLWDSQLQVTCFYVTANDGTLRCLPWISSDDTTSV